MPKRNYTRKRQRQETPEQRVENTKHPKISGDAAACNENTASGSNEAIATSRTSDGGVSSSNTVRTDHTASGKSLKFVGAHTSISGGPQTAVLQAVEIGAKAFALFVRSARTWKCPPLKPENVEKFKQVLTESGIDASKIVCHGSYLINPGSPDDSVLEKARAGMLDEMQRCEMLGIPYYNIHPGSTCGKITVDECITRIAASANDVLAQTFSVTLLLENMCGQGSTIGGKFEELAAIIGKIDQAYQHRVGVCIDTCHAFAAGNDIRTEEGWNTLMSDVDRTVGLKRVKAFHLNDSMFACGAHRDRHAHIGKGLIGLDGFRWLMNDPRTNNLPMILETEDSMWKEEIELLYSLCAN
ncbi:probable endonuclease 4 [Paramacrobiotus metropolitanus]|uniref:probable endonuclease 4 n=1 Tax=Paramacrobiotus metropolitanus TaxID=2943436 RepID=UPI0024461478|nr:probable endonuclease 4 [Paramacrobiotus metropolitanus]